MGRRVSYILFNLIQAGEAKQPIASILATGFDFHPFSSSFLEMLLKLWDSELMQHAAQIFHWECMILKLFCKPSENKS